MKIMVGGIQLGAPKIVPESLSCCCYYFSFSQLEIGFALPAVRRRFIVDTPRTRLLLCPPGCSGDARDQATIAVVAAFSGGGATHAAGPHQAGSGSESAPIAARSRTPTLMLLKEDAVALFSCTIYHRSRLIIMLNLSARRC
jgi:hypothetical protein